METAVFKHLYTRWYSRSIGFSYWRGKKGHEVDMIFDTVTKDILDFGVTDLPGLNRPVRVLKIPAPLACYWLGQMELVRSDQEAE